MNSYSGERSVMIKSTRFQTRIIHYNERLKDS